MADPNPSSGPSPESPSPSSRSKGAVFASRLLSTLLLWGGIAAGMIWGPPWVILLIAFAFGVAGAAEFAVMALRDDPLRRNLFLLVTVLWLGLVCLTLHRGGSDSLWQLVDLGGLAIVVLVAFLPSLRTTPSEADYGAACRFGFGFLHLVFLFSFIPRLFALEGPEGSGVARLLLLIASAKFTDMGAYLTGSLIGKHKMIPRVSPGKTWEGFCGGLVFAVAICVGLVFLLPEKLAPLTPSTAVLLGVVIALLAVVGDLFESVVKRVSGAKDSGRWLPGIGGIFDLTDSLLFAAPAYWALLVILS